ncbi:EAL domain-containing protein [Pseudocitrobacter sp. 73]|uniref:EAL domain-containing protein n=1 Tax=Pseudocitrobacter sp. 73 TaxID=2605731 RepID=UPI0011EFE572|nr:EAL domain-containing protein [Pseudocitrobacter sp. 73]KAA1051093.1 EAL domain-containing protein [Pseudocitrobacter sp. 73]
MKAVGTKFRIITTLFCVLTILVGGAVLTWFQVIGGELEQTSALAKKTVQKIDSLLNASRQAATKAHPLLSQPCTTQTRTELERLVVSVPHIRIINLYKEKTLFCSSYNDANAINMNYAAHTAQELTIIDDKTISPGDKVIVLQTAYPEGMITSSFSGQWLSEVLELLSNQRPLTLHIGDTVMRQNAKTVPNDNARHVIVQSDKFPYSVDYPAWKTVPVSLYLQQGWLSLLLTLCLALIVGVVLWQHILHHPTLYENLERAIAEGEIVPWYQPVIHSGSGKFYGVEVLARWVTPSGEIISPDSFIPLAEESGLIVPLTRKLMALAGDELPSLLETRPLPFHVSFNFTASHIQTPNFIDECRAFLKRFPENSIRLTAEITEREPFEKVNELKETLIFLESRSVTIALDDFGTGYSNLNLLTGLPVGLIKIDKLFVNGISSATDSTKLIDCVIDMAKSLGMKIIVEGVETEYQVAYLTHKQVDYFQGYYFSKPLPVNELAAAVNKTYRIPQLEEISHA